MASRPFLFTVSLLLLSCVATPTPNQAIESWDGDALLRPSPLASPGRSGELLLALTFSGGGTRAAAFAFGALQELAATRVKLGGQERRLFDEIDLISSVSGGSFTAAYLGLRGEKIFDDFEEVFLRRNIQASLVLELLRPVNWLRMFRIDRSQLAARYYDRAIFEGASFADLRRPDAPQVVINATDLATASRFPFNPFSFGLICSDLDSYPVALAVRERATRDRAGTSRGSSSTASTRSRLDTSRTGISGSWSGRSTRTPGSTSWRPCEPSSAGCTRAESWRWSPASRPWRSASTCQT